MPFFMSYFHNLTKIAVRFLLILIYLGCFAATIGQVVVQPVAARYLSMGAYSRQFNDVFGSAANPAALATLKRAGVGVYGEKRFMLDNLNMYNLSAALPTNSGTFGLFGNYFGSAQSNHTQLSIAYGRKIVETIEIGASFHYQTISQAGIYGNSSVVTGSVGMLLHLSEKITAGINAFNPFRAVWNKTTDNERLPAKYNFGIGYDASENFLLTTELEKEESLPLNVNVAMHYRLIPQLFVRGGISSLTSSYFAGFGLELTQFRLDLTTSFHPQLGFSPGIVLLYNFGKSKDEKE
jgi:hypothetical protein